MNFTDIECPTCGARIGSNCANLVRKKSTGVDAKETAKAEWKESEIHKARKSAMVSKKLQEASAKMLSSTGW